MDEDQHTPVESSRETHATTGGAAAAGAVVAGAIGLTSGPLGAAIGAIGGALVGAAAERMMHSEDDRVLSEPRDENSTTE
jgi:outer membrane lipoprotein SlyB